ncbi:hypothetical protein ACFQX6_01070 [Streptosporangium lutulentum]
MRPPSTITSLRLVIAMSRAPCGPISWARPSTSTVTGSSRAESTSSVVLRGSSSTTACARASIRAPSEVRRRAARLSSTLPARTFRTTSFMSSSVRRLLSCSGDMPG